MLKKLFFSAIFVSLLLWGGIGNVFAMDGENLEHKILDLELIAGQERYVEAPFSFQVFAIDETEEVQVKFMQNNVWTEWRSLLSEEDSDLGPLSFVDRSQALALRSKRSIEVRVVLMRFVGTATVVAENDNLMLDTVLVYEDSELKIISRRDWGADESLATYIPDDDPDGSESSVGNLCDKIENAYPAQYSISRQVDYFDERGRNLIWPRRYSTRVKKIVIHHTAQDLKDLNGDHVMNSRDYRLSVQAIYKYHTVTRGWGDVGYHYIIDPLGNIYEGRAGGLKVVGAHILCQNSNTVGVAVMGNFENVRLPAKAYEGLVKITHYLTETYDINPLGKSSFRGTVLPHIVTHAEVGLVTKGYLGQGATSCPGRYIKKSMSKLRTAVSQGGIKPALAYEIVDKPKSSYVDPLETFDIWLKLKNTGEDTWSSVKLYEGRNVVVDKKMQRVASGQTMTVKIPFEADIEAGRMNYALNVALNGTKQRRKVEFFYKVRRPVYSYRVVSIEGNEDTLLVGEERQLKIKLKNTSNFVWPAEGKYQFKLQEVKQRQNRVALVPRGVSLTLSRDLKVGGEIGFEIDIPVPRKKGQFSLELQPMIGRDRGLKGKQLLAAMPVELPDFEFEVLQADRRQRLKAGESDWIKFEIVNNSNFDWEPGSVWYSAGRRGEKQSIKETVEIGESYTFRYEMKASKRASEVKFSGYVGIDRLPQRIKVRRFREEKKRFEVTVDVLGRAPAEVEEKEDQNSKFEIQNSEVKPPMRVWLTELDLGIVEFTSPGDYVTWDSETVQVVWHGAGEVFQVSKEDLSGGVIIRARVKEEPYFEFTNWDRIRSFGAGINDNKFRGVLEFRIDEGEMIVINELPLKDYMKGIAEVPETADQPQEKRKVIAVLARSYALHYLISGYEKFPGKPYNSADSPAIFQKYVGYNFELRAPKWLGALEETVGEVILVDSDESVLRAAYFSCTDGAWTKTPVAAGWGENEYFQEYGDVFQSVEDPLGDDPGREGLQACGHQVGLSGYGATQMAKDGKGYEEIIEYYYQGVGLGVY